MRKKIISILYVVDSCKFDVHTFCNFTSRTKTMMNESETDVECGLCNTMFKKVKLLRTMHAQTILKKMAQIKLVHALT